jgi:hypothetical protein
MFRKLVIGSAYLTELANGAGAPKVIFEGIYISPTFSTRIARVALGAFAAG